LRGIRGEEKKSTEKGKVAPMTTRIENSTFLFGIWGLKTLSYVVATGERTKSCKQTLITGLGTYEKKT